MHKVDHLDDWSSYTEVAQDVAPVVIHGSGGLYTRKLMNCICIVVTNGVTYTMMHVAPDHESFVRWGRSMMNNVPGANQALVSGANGTVQSSERIEELRAIFAGSQLQVIDETHRRWLPADIAQGGRAEGEGFGITGFVAVSAVSGDYMLGVDAPHMAIAVRDGASGSASARRRRIACCVIM